MKDEPKRRHPLLLPPPETGPKAPKSRRHDSTSKRAVRQDLAALTLQDRLRVDGRQPRLLRVAQNDRPQGSGDILQAIRGAEAHAGRCSAS